MGFLRRHDPIVQSAGLGVADVGLIGDTDWLCSRKTCEVCANLYHRQARFCGGCPSPRPAV
jgi:hypothetical protein